MNSPKTLSSNFSSTMQNEVASSVVTHNEPELQKGRKVKLECHIKRKERDMTITNSLNSRTIEGLKEDAYWEGVVRLARKPWRCIGAEPIRGYTVKGTAEGGWASSWARTLEQAERIKLSKERNGRFASRFVPYDSVEIIPEPNPRHSADCLKDIPVGAIYYEYQDDTQYRSGTRYCVSCAVRTFGE